MLEVCRGLMFQGLSGLAGLLFFAQAEAQGPAVNLQVSWRVSAQAEQSRVAVQSPPGVTVQTNRRQHEQVQSVIVLNGGQARLFMGRSVPVSIWQLAWKGGVESGVPAAADLQAWAATQTQWVDLGEGLTVRPRWSGERGPVVVELEASARQPVQAGELTMASAGGYEPEGQSRRTEVLSTVSVPLGQWTVVARRGEQMQRQQAGTWSTRHINSTAQEVLEIRVSLP